MKETPINDSNMKLCSKFDICNSPLCIIDAFKSKRIRETEDSNCIMQKGRVRAILKRIHKGEKGTKQVVPMSDTFHNN